MFSLFFPAAAIIPSPRSSFHWKYYSSPLTGLFTSASVHYTVTKVVCLKFSLYVTLLCVNTNFHSPWPMAVVSNVFLASLPGMNLIDKPCLELGQVQDPRTPRAPTLCPAPGPHLHLPLPSYRTPPGPALFPAPGPHLHLPSPQLQYSTWTCPLPSSRTSPVPTHPHTSRTPPAPAVSPAPGPHLDPRPPPTPTPPGPHLHLPCPQLQDPQLQEHWHVGGIWAPASTV